MNVKDIQNHLDQALDLKKNFDILKRDFSSKNIACSMYYLTSLLDLFQFHYLLNTLEKVKSYEELLNDSSFPSISLLTKEEDLYFFLFSGAVILFFKEENVIINCDIRAYPSRGIDEPDAEKVVRGSRDGFSENIITNVALIRRRIKDQNLCMEHFILSDISKMSVVLCYMKGKIDVDVIKEIRKKLETIKVHSLVMSDRALEEKLFKQGKIIFPLVKYTERHDVASIQVLNGKALIMVDTSASCLITPITLFDHLKHVEEFRETPLVGSVTRTLRSISIFLSIYLVPTFLCFISDHDIDNHLLNIHVSNEGNISYFAQAICATILLEILRIASIHTPSFLASGISLVAALILGQISMDLGLFIPEILLLVAVSSICSFATPSYELALGNKLVSFIFIILSGLFGYEGLIIGTILLFIYLVSIKIFSIPYLYPICPFDAKSFLNVFIRKNARKKKNL